MILELVSFLGTSVGGKIFGIIGDTLAERRHAKREDARAKHERKLARQGELRTHLEQMHSQDKSGGYSPLSWVVSICVLMLCITYCTATIECFTNNPTEIIHSKDPTATTVKREILFGTISWDSADNRVLAMSKLGCGILLLYPAIFILSMVTTGDRPRGR